MIVIVHLKRSAYHVSPLFKCDRSTVLGNVASHLPKSSAKHRTKTVDEAVEYFKHYLKDEVKVNKNPVILNALEEIYQAARQHEVIYLGCWCMDELDARSSDHNCHCTVIRKVIESRLKRNQ